MTTRDTKGKPAAKTNGKPAAAKRPAEPAGKPVRDDDVVLPPGEGTDPIPGVN